MKKLSKEISPNLTAKHAHKFNKCLVFKDKKKAHKRGLRKHEDYLQSDGA